MACGIRKEVLEWTLTVCHVNVPYPCGIIMCSTSVPYPCGIQWCRGWLGIWYPCKIIICHFNLPYPCGIRICTVSVPYPCIKKVPVTKYCYEFVSTGHTCYFLVDKLYGCCNGQEYDWFAPCLFVSFSASGKPSPGSAGSFVSHYTKCFDEPLTSTGACQKGNSLPPTGDIPGGPLDESSVAPRPAAIVRGTQLKNFESFLKKFGTCPKCMKLSFLLSLLTWLAIAIILHAGIHLSLFQQISLGMLFCAINGIFLGHLAGFLIGHRNIVSFPARGCGCDK